MFRSSINHGAMSSSGKAAAKLAEILRKGENGSLNCLALFQIKDLRCAKKFGFITQKKSSLQLMMLSH